MISRRELCLTSLSFVIFFVPQIEVSSDCSANDLKELLTSIAGLNRLVYYMRAVQCSCHKLQAALRAFE